MLHESSATERSGIRSPEPAAGTARWQAALENGEILVAVNPSVVGAYQGEVAVLLQSDSEEYIGLNAVATVVWKHLCNSRSFADIVEAISIEYEVTPGVAKADVARLLKALHTRGALRVRDGGQ